MKQIVLTFVVLARSLTQTVAQDWTPFGIKRFGFIFDLPPGFNFVNSLKEEGAEGAVFRHPDGDILAVWGVDLDQRDFLASIKDQMQQDEGEGWNITYKRVTPKWAAYSGVKEGLIRYVKAITVCDDRAAFFLMDYDRNQKIEYDPIVTQMEKSMKRERCQ